MAAMFHWLEDDTFDCTVGIVVDDSPVAVGVFVNDRLVITSANPLDNMPKHRIKIYAINGSPHGSKVVAIDFITTHKERVSKRVRIGSDNRHNTVHDLTLISVIDDETVFSKHQSLPRRPYYLPLAEREAETSTKGWSFAGFGFANKRHVKNSNTLKAVVHRDQVVVDCKEYIHSEWGQFICILNLDNFAGVQSGAPLFHQNAVYGVGSFSFTKNNESILVFTDVRAYRGKLVYLYTKDWWWG